jgi:hypothetical protein
MGPIGHARPPQCFCAAPVAVPVTVSGWCHGCVLTVVSISTQSIVAYSFESLCRSPTVQIPPSRALLAPHPEPGLPCRQFERLQRSYRPGAHAERKSGSFGSQRWRRKDRRCFVVFFSSAHCMCGRDTHQIIEKPSTLVEAFAVLQAHASDSTCGARPSVGQREQRAASQPQRACTGVCAQRRLQIVVRAARSQWEHGTRGDHAHSERPR